jgi:hypothetical protein
MKKTIQDVKVGDRVVWFSPRMEGRVDDADYSSIKIQWDDGTASIERRADGFIGWGLLCSHVWDGPRIEVAEGCSVGTCSKCGASASPELTGALNPHRPATPGPDKKDESPGSTNPTSPRNRGSWQ